MKISKGARLDVRRLALVVGVLILAVVSNPSAKTKGRNLLAAYGADAVTIDRNAREITLPDQIEWKGRPGSGIQSALLYGDPSKPGLYVQLLKRGPDNWTEPHSHPNDRVITVLAGTMLVGTGSKLDRNNTVAVKAGGHIRDFANQMHYDGTGPTAGTYYTYLTP